MTGRAPLRIRAALGAIGVVVASVWVTEIARANPGNDYMLQCQGCHMADGRGSPGIVPDLRNQMGLFLGVEGGREFLVSVPGSAQAPLSNTELANVLNWMIREFGPEAVAESFAPFTAEEVGLHRRPLADVEPVRKILIERIAALP